MSKKNLDQLFREKLEDFTDVPTEKVWKSIEASLNMKKKTERLSPFGGNLAVLPRRWQSDYS